MISLITLDEAQKITADEVERRNQTLSARADPLRSEVNTWIRNASIEGRDAVTLNVDKYATDVILLVVDELRNRGFYAVHVTNSMGPHTPDVHSLDVSWS